MIYNWTRLTDTISGSGTYDVSGRRTRCQDSLQQISRLYLNQTQYAICYSDLSTLLYL